MDIFYCSSLAVKVIWSLRRQLSYTEFKWVYFSLYKLYQFVYGSDIPTIIESVIYTYTGRK